jgi:hypothetical protein
VRRIARFFLDLFHQFLDLAFACNIHEAAALVNEGIREQADKARFKRCDKVLLVRHVDYDGSCRMRRGAFLRNGRIFQENESESNVAIHTDPFMSCEGALVERPSSWP